MGDEDDKKKDENKGLPDKSGDNKNILNSTPSQLSPVEKIIFDKYGDIGLRVYTLVDGNRTAEEMMHETGLTEVQIVEMLDFMDEQGIIKLDYPKGKTGTEMRLAASTNSLFIEIFKAIEGITKDDLTKLANAIARKGWVWDKISELQAATEIEKSKLMKILKILEMKKVLLLKNDEYMRRPTPLVISIIPFNATEQGLYQKTNKQFGLDGICFYYLIDNKTPLSELGKKIPKAKQIAKIFINDKIMVFDPFSKQKIPCMVKKTTSDFLPLIYDYRSKEDLKELRKHNKGLEKSIRYYELGIFSRAAEELEKSRRKDVVYYVNNGAIELMNGNFTEAISEFTKALDLNPKNIKALYNRALASGETENAFADLNLAIELKSDNPFLYYLRGKCFEHSKKFSNAVKDYEKAIKLKSDFELAKRGLETARAKIPLEVNAYDDLSLPKISPNAPNYKLSDVGGMKKLKEGPINMKLLILKNPEKAKEYDLYFGGGIIFYGPYGCGKTYLSEAIAGEAGISFFKAKIADIINKWAGNSEKNLHNLFEAARTAQPAIIFFDEIDALGGSREEINEHWGRVFINQFLKEMDAVKQNNENILVIGATNALWHIDPALTRTGRFSEVIFINPPVEQERAEIFKIHTRTIKAPMTINFEALAKATDGISGSDIQYICEEIRQNAFKEALQNAKESKITTDDFIRIIENGKKERKFNKVKEWLEMAKRYEKSPPEGKPSGSKEYDMFR